MQKEVYLTKEKLAELKQELENLKKVKRPEIIMKIKEARALGDLSENAEYHSAREEQGRIEGRIEEIEYMIKKAKIISESCKSKSKVDLGCKVSCKIEGGDDGKAEFTLVGSAEADPLEGKISNESPIGKALMGKKVGDVAEADTPVGKMKFKVLSIK